MPGRKPRPSNLRFIEGRGNGRDSGGRLIPAAPAFVRLPPAAPEWLPDEARAEWDRVVPGLMRLKVLKPEDRAVLTAYCLTWASFVAAQKTIEAEGANIDSARGRIRHPAQTTLENARRDLRSLASEFGLTPSSEGNLGKAETDDGQDDNPFA